MNIIRVGSVDKAHDQGTGHYTLGLKEPEKKTDGGWRVLVFEEMLGSKNPNHTVCFIDCYWSMI